MQTVAPFADTGDVADVWRPYASNDEQIKVESLIEKAWSKLRQATPFNIETRVALHSTDPTALTALDPLVVADVVAGIVKRFLVNTEGAATVSEASGPFSHSATYVNRYDKTGSDVRGAIQATPGDVEQLRPAVPAGVPSTIRTNIPDPRILFPRGNGASTTPGQPAVVPDLWPDSGVE